MILVFGLIIEKVWSKQYPWSLGLFYSAITKREGLKPNEDEYITMGMAAFGKPCINMEDVLDEYLHTGIPLKKWFWNKPGYSSKCTNATRTRAKTNIYRGS